MIIPVDSADDDRLEPYLRVRERDLARRDGVDTDAVGAAMQREMPGQSDQSGLRGFNHIVG